MVSFWRGDEITTYDDSVFFEKSVKISILQRDHWKMITDYKFNTTDSLDAIMATILLDEMKFEPHTQGESKGDKTVKL